MSEETAFFEVRVEVWRIDDSRPAPHFTLIAAPNEWRREAARTIRATVASERNLRFQALIGALRERGFTRARRAQPQSWYASAAGHAQRVQYAAAFEKRRRAGVEVYIDNTDRVWNKALFDRLMERRESIEGELGTELEWSRLDERRASRIALLRDASIDDDDAGLDEARN